MSKQFLSVCASLMLATACIHAQTPMQYNNKLVSITDSLHAKGTRWVMTFQQVRVVKEFTMLTPYRKDLEKYIGDEIDILKADKDVSGSGELRDAVLGFLHYEQEVVQKGFAPMEELDENSSDDELKAAIGNISQLSQKEDSVLAQVNMAQMTYANKNHFNINVPDSK